MTDWTPIPARRPTTGASFDQARKRSEILRTIRVDRAKELSDERIRNTLPRTTVHWMAGCSPRGWRYGDRGIVPWGINDGDIRINRLREDDALLLSPDGEGYICMANLFASFRLRMHRRDRKTDPLDRIQLALRAVELSLTDTHPGVVARQVYGGSVSYMDDHMHWLQRERLIDYTDDISQATLTVEGRAALWLIETDLAPPGTTIDMSAIGVYRMREARLIPAWTRPWDRETTTSPFELRGRHRR